MGDTTFLQILNFIVTWNSYMKNNSDNETEASKLLRSVKHIKQFNHLGQKLFAMTT